MFGMIASLRWVQEAKEGGVVPGLCLEEWVKRQGEVMRGNTRH